MGASRQGARAHDVKHRQGNAGLCPPPSHPLIHPTHPLIHPTPLLLHPRGLSSSSDTPLTARRSCRALAGMGRVAREGGSSRDHTSSSTGPDPGPGPSPGPSPLTEAGREVQPPTLTPEREGEDPAPLGTQAPVPGPTSGSKSRLPPETRRAAAAAPAEGGGGGGGANTGAAW